MKRYQTNIKIVKKKDGLRLKKSLRFLKSPLFKRWTERFKRSLLLCAPTPVQNKKLCQGERIPQYRVGTRVRIRVRTRARTRARIQPRTRVRFPAISTKWWSHDQWQQTIFQAMAEGKLHFFFFFMNAIMGRRTGHPKENLHWRKSIKPNGQIYLAVLAITNSFWKLCLTAKENHVALLEPPK